MTPPIEELVKFIVVHYDICEVMDMLEEFTNDEDDKKVVKEKINYAIDDEGFHYLIYFSSARFRIISEP